MKQAALQNLLNDTHGPSSTQQEGTRQLLDVATAEAASLAKPKTAAAKRWGKVKKGVSLRQRVLGSAPPRQQWRSVVPEAEADAVAAWLQVRRRRDPQTAEEALAAKVGALILTPVTP